MKEKNIYTIKNLPKDQTNLKQVRKLKDHQINKAARTDPDAPLLTKKELSQFKRVHPPQDIDVKNVREKLHVSQSVFAAIFGISLRTLQDWEQGRRIPRGPARILLTLISKKPKLIQEVLLS